MLSSLFVVFASFGGQVNDCIRALHLDLSLLTQLGGRRAGSLVDLMAMRFFSPCCIGGKDVAK